MRSSHIKKALENAGIGLEQAESRLDEVVSRLNTLAVITHGLHPDNKDSVTRKDVIVLPYDNQYALSIELSAFAQAAKAFVKASFASEADILFLDPYSRGISLLPLSDLGRGSRGELINSAAVPFMEVNKSDVFVDDLTVGLIVLCGLNKSGKSIMGNGVLNPDVRIRHGEPKEEKWDLHPQAIRASRFTSAIFGCLAFGAIGLSTEIDSLKNEAYRISGAAGKGGIQPQLVLVLSDLSLLASYLYAPILALVNPMVEEDGMALFANQADSNVSAYIYMKRSAEGKASVFEAYARKDGDRVSIKQELSSRLEKYFADENALIDEAARSGYTNFTPDNVNARISIPTVQISGLTGSPFSQTSDDNASITEAALPVSSQDRAHSEYDHNEDELFSTPHVVTHRF